MCLPNATLHAGQLPHSPGALASRSRLPPRHWLLSERVFLLYLEPQIYSVFPQVRLLTGIGRYNEMTYIFELLHEKHYFEVLMRKKLDPVGGGG